MIGLRIGAAELAEIEAGAPCVVLAPGLLLPHAPPLVPLVLKGGVLARPGAETRRTLPLPPDVTPLALIAPADLAPALAAMLPPGLPVHHETAALPALLAAALAAEGAARRAAEADRDLLRRALASLGAPKARLALELPPGTGRAEAPLTQPLGRPAEGLAGLELHLAAGGAGLRARLSAGERVLGLWIVPEAAVRPGWLALDLPEPAPPGPEEAVLEVLEAPALSAGAEPGAPLALRLWTAGPGWSVLPRHFVWAAAGARHPALPLPLPAALLAEARSEGAEAELVRLGEEAARLMLRLAPGAAASLHLPAFPTGPADLLRARIAAVTGEGAEFALDLEAEGGRIGSGWRPTGPGLVMLPLPPGPMARLGIALRNAAAAPCTVEIGELALMAGAGGERRRAPDRGPEPAPRLAVGPALAAAAGAWRAAPPAPRLAAALPGGAPPSPLPPAQAPAYQDLGLNQHLVNGDGSYRHLDIGVSGLVSGGGLWRQLRLKLFDRRGVVGLEFREMKGWPQMFDVWPGTRSDNFGPFWRLETEAAGDALAGLATPHDRALIAALVEVLPDLAARAARLAGLAGREAEDWPERARRLAQAVAAARGLR